MPDCSIIIPVHNHASLTRQCLNRLELPTSARPEIIVIDDASTDITAELLRSFRNQIRVVSQTIERGFAASCNQVASLVTGDFMIFLNNDALPQPGWLDNLLQYAREHPRAAVVGAKLLHPDDTVQHAGVVICQDRYPRYIYTGFPADHPAVCKSRPFQIVTSACALVRRDVFASFNGFDTHYMNGYEDVDLCLRLGAAGYEIHYCHTSVLYQLELVTRGLQPLDENLERYRERWLEHVVPDEFRYYLDDGLIQVHHSPSYPLELEISPLLSTLQDSSREAKADHLLNLRARQSSQQRRALVELYAALGEMQLAHTPRAGLPGELNVPMPGQPRPYPSYPVIASSGSANNDEDLISPDAENKSGGHFIQVGEHVANLLRTYGGLKSTDRILEVGSGYGQIAFPLLKYLQDGGSYQGLDINSEAVEWCQTRITPRYPNFRFLLADVYDKSHNPEGKVRASEFKFRYPDSCFDFVFLASVFTHMLPDDMAHYLDEIARVLAPGGRCLITCFLLNPESLSSMSGEWNFVRDFGDYHALQQETPENIVAYDEEFVRALYAKCGLEIREPIVRGTWSGRKSAPTLQDILVACKAHTQTPAARQSPEVQERNSQRTLMTPLPASAPARVVAQGNIQPLKGGTNGPLYSILMPVKNGAKLLSELLPRVLAQQAEGHIEIIAVDSSSDDNTIDILNQYNATILAISPELFNHGLTRNLAANYAHGDIFVFLNQTAVPADEMWLANLTAPLAQDQNLAGVCSRPMPRGNDDPLVRRDVLRDPNSTVESRVTVITNWCAYQSLDPNALRLFINFHSISAAIRPQVLERIPLPAVPLIGEDLTWAKQVLEAGYALRNEASSVVFHSHAYSHTELLQRNFDDAVLNNALVGRQIDAAMVIPGIVAAIGDDWRYLEQEHTLPPKELEKLRVESVMRRTAQWVGQWLGGHLADLPTGALSHLALTESIKAISIRPTAPPLPPPELRFRVCGTKNPDLFVSSGEANIQDFTRCLEELGYRWTDLERVLEFGCGCGRLTRRLQEMIPAGRLAAVDIDEEAIAWMRANLPAVDARQNRPLPPLPFEDACIDLVVGYSVFSHLNEAYQDAWLAELARVTEPGALLLLTVHGPKAWESMRADISNVVTNIEELESQLLREGILFWTGDLWERYFPDFYHTMWHLPEYIRHHWSRWFTVVDILEGGAQPTHDLVVLRRSM